MPDLGLISLLTSNVTAHIKDLSGEVHKVKVNWIRLFDQANNLYAAGFTYLEEYGGCGIHLFKVDTKTGEFTPVINLLYDEGLAKEVREHMEI